MYWPFLTVYFLIMFRISSLISWKTMLRIYLELHLNFYINLGRFYFNYFSSPWVKCISYAFCYSLMFYNKSFTNLHRNLAYLCCISFYLPWIFLCFALFYYYYILDWLMHVNKNIKDVCILIFYPASLLNCKITFNSWCVYCLAFSM